MEKKHDFREISNKLCVSCGKPLKLSLVIKNPYANKCFNCYRLEERRELKVDVTRTKMVKGKVVKTKRTINRVDVQQKAKKVYGIYS